VEVGCIRPRHLHLTFRRMDSRKRTSSQGPCPLQRRPGTFKSGKCTGRLALVSQPVKPFETLGLAPSPWEPKLDWMRPAHGSAVGFARSRSQCTIASPYRTPLQFHLFHLFHQFYQFHQFHSFSTSFHFRSCPSPDFIGPSLAPSPACQTLPVLIIGRGKKASSIP
jgi:hypothetical protein